MNSGLDGEKNFCGRFSHQCRIINNRNQWPMAKTVDINTDAKGFVRNLNQKGVRNLIPRQGCQVSRWFDILRGEPVVVDTIWRDLFRTTTLGKTSLV